MIALIATFAVVECTSSNQLIPLQRRGSWVLDACFVLLPRCQPIFLENVIVLILDYLSQISYPCLQQASVIPAP